jgi:hypothetical protein
MAARYPGHHHLHAANIALMGVDLSDIGDELTSFWAEVQYRAMDYWVEPENVQAWATSGGGDGDESVVVRQRMAWNACRDLLRRAPMKPETGTGSPAVVVYWQALSLLSLIHANEGRTVPPNVWNGMGPGAGDDHQPGADDLAGAE